LKSIFSKGLTLISVTCFLSSSCFAQSGKTSIAILDFTASSGIDQRFVQTAQEATTQGFVRAKRFVIVDRSRLDAIQNERNLQKSEEFILSSFTVEQRSAIGAQFLVQGTVTNGSVKSTRENKTSAKGVTKYSVRHDAQLAVSIRVVDVSTGTSDVAVTISGSGSSGGFYLGAAQSGTQEQASSTAINNLTKEVDKWIGKTFPAQFAIVEIQSSDDKSGAQQVLVAGGTGTGLIKGERLTVILETVINVNGTDKKRFQEVGELKVMDLDGEDFSICKVVSGGSGILQRFNSKEKIYAQTIK
jgi:curli biogenesis system outer membrane secretion channel CsgG